MKCFYASVSASFDVESFFNVSIFKAYLYDLIVKDYDVSCRQATGRAGRRKKVFSDYGMVADRVGR